jgi:hypothetical protein
MPIVSSFVVELDDDELEVVPAAPPVNGFILSSIFFPLLTEAFSPVESSNTLAKVCVDPSPIEEEVLILPSTHDTWSRINSIPGILQYGAFFIGISFEFALRSVPSKKFLNMSQLGTFTLPLEPRHLLAIENAKALQQLLMELKTAV